MSDGLELDLFEDGPPIGFRLQRFEVYNWGTFDRRVWSLVLDGRNGLLTGDIGSGKSTLVDGLTTLLVAPNRISYNKAAGAEHRERTLGSYVLGHYKHESSESSSRARPVALRDPSHYSVLLAVFANAALGQSVTLAAVFAFKDTSAAPARLFVVAEQPLTIAEHFSDFGTDLNGLRRRLRGAGARLHDSYPPYAAEFRRLFGIKHPQAMDLFHQTVSMKSVGNLTEFVRQHMLEPSEVDQRIADLISHYEDLTRSHDAVLQAKKQVEALTPLVADLDRHDEVAQRVEEFRELRDALRPHFARRKRVLLTTRLSALNIDRAKLQARRERTDREHADAQRSEVDLLAAIAQNGGDRITGLERQIDEAQERRDKKRRTASDYERLCTALQLSPAEDPDGLRQQLEVLARSRAELEDSRAEYDNERGELAVALGDSRKRLAEADAELAGLAQRDSNIDERMVAIRGRMAEDLNLPTEQLPFVGELVRVTDPVWEPAAERLLRGFGLSLLVPDRHYAAVSRWVDATNLRGRLVYFRVRSPRRTVPVTDQRSLVLRLEVKPGTAFTDWVTAEVEHRFDLVCARTTEEFTNASFAITRMGLIKTGNDRHEKDDRHAIDDRRRYVLGWDNAAKRAALTAAAGQLREQLQRLDQQLAGLKSKTAALHTRADQLTRLGEVKDFADLDWRAEAGLIEELQGELNQLRSASDLLQNLHQQLDASRTAQRELATKLGDILERLGGASAKIEHAEQESASLADIAVELEPQLAARLDELERSEIADGLTVENCRRVEDDLRTRLSKEIESADQRIRRVGEAIVRRMTDFRQSWKLLSEEFDATVAAGHEYRTLLGRLTDDDLPRFEETFRRQLKENAIQRIVGFSTHLDASSQGIKHRVGTINDSLREINYQPHTYIRLEPATTTDADIRQFRQLLKACTQDTVTGSQDDSYSEEKFLQVKEIVSRLAGRAGRTEEDRRWRSRVTDVRNWFNFAVSERLRADDTEHEHYSDSGGKSGGQKEKLAYTILAASLAYQFGLVTGETHSRTFRFVVIDEAFGRGSDESARFGLELFATLQLQLLVVTPLQKIHIIEPHVSRVGYVHNEGGATSRVRNLTIEEYHDLWLAAATAVAKA